MLTHASEIHLHTEVVIFKFQGGIPSSQVAAALKFGLEALPGVDGVHFTEIDGIEIVVDRDRTRMEPLWNCMVQAGFRREAVILCGGTLSEPDLPAEMTNDGEAQTGSGAAA